MPADEYSAFQINHLQQVMRSTDSVGVAFRGNAHLPVVADSAISVETDQATCNRVRATYNSVMDPSARVHGALYVIRAGKVYIASSPAMTDREFQPQIIINERFKFIGAYGR
jgi:hypothetical protein